MFSENDPGIEVDVSNFPLVIQRVGAVIDDAQMARYLEALEALLARKQPFASITIVKRRGHLERSTISAYGEFTKRHEEAMREHYKGAAFVFPGEVFRLVLSAIIAVSPAKVPYKVFSKQDEAYAWAAALISYNPRTAPILWP